MAKKSKAANNEPRNSLQTAPAPLQPQGLPEGFTVTKQITLPSLALKNPNQQAVLRFDSAMRISEIVDKPQLESDGKTLKKPRDPATIANVTDAVTGEQFIFIVPAVVKENLNRDYKKDAYVGKTFYIVNKGKRKEGQRYNDFSIAEVAGK